MALGRYGLVESAALRSRRAQRWVPIDVGNPTQGRLLVLELEALVGREVEEDVVLAASGADLGGGAVRVLKAHH